MTGFFSTTSSLRYAKLLYVFAVGALGALVAIDNLIDYGANFEYTVVILSMQETFPDNPARWRAIDSPWLQHAGFLTIVLTEALIGLFGLWGAVDLWRNRHDDRAFHAAKAKGAIALTLGVALWFVGFLVVAGEWFMMWQTGDYNAQQSAFRFAVLCALGLIFLQGREDPA